MYSILVFNHINYIMKPSVKDKLMRDYSWKPWIDMSIILWVWKWWEKPVPTVEKIWDDGMLWDGGDIMQWIESLWLWWTIVTADSIFSNIMEDINSMEDEELLKLVHMITMKALEAKED